jgi:predicted Zn-dependent protease
MAIVLALAALLAGPSAEPGPAKFRARVVLVPMGYFPDELIDTIRRDLEDELQVDVVVGREAWPPVDDVYDPARRSFFADALVDFLRGQLFRHRHVTHVLGLMDVPLVGYNPESIFGGLRGEIFGRADPAGHVAVMSIAHWRPGERLHPLTIRHQASTLAVRFVGELLGLDGSERTDCAMDDEAPNWNLPMHLCATCRRRLSSTAPPIL